MSLFSHAVSCPPLGPASTESNLGNLTCPFRQCPGLSEGWVVCGWEQDFHNRSKASARHNFSYLSNMTVHERETQCPRHGHRWFSKSSTGCVPQTKWLNLQPLYPRDVAQCTNSCQVPISWPAPSPPLAPPMPHTQPASCHQTGWLSVSKLSHGKFNKRKIPNVHVSRCFQARCWKSEVVAVYKLPEETDKFRKESGRFQAEFRGSVEIPELLLGNENCLPSQ